MKFLIKLILITQLILAASCLKEDDQGVLVPPLESAILEPEVGGAAEPNQVWIDLSTNETYTNNRAAWDLGFYSGPEFRVILNNSTLMAAASIDSYSIDAVSQSDFQNLISILEPPANWSEIYIDDVKGNYLDEGTVIKEISDIDAENKVYLLKLGYETYTGSDIPPYSVYTIGNSRGFKKIRILKNDENSYKIQYADLNDNSHQEAIVQKDEAYNFSFYSFATQESVEVQPTKKNWDLCFTVFNNVIEGFGTYTYADFVINNTLSGVVSYQVITDAATLQSDYQSFNFNDIDESQFVLDDQRAIGSNWRSTVSGTSSSPVVFPDRFFVLKDPDGNYFKIRFLSMINGDNMRGYPKFEYQKLN